MTEIIELPRQSDGTGFYLHFTGGFRAANLGEGGWRIEPVFVNDKPCATGPLTMAQLQLLTTQNKFRAIAFQRLGWMDGVYHSAWAPIVPEKANHSEGPAELWSNIAGNISRPRTKELFESAKHPAEEEIAKALDDQHPVEALASYVSLSLRSMDISVEQIAEHYHEQLVNHMAPGASTGKDPQIRCPKHCMPMSTRSSCILERRETTWVRLSPTALASTMQRSTQWRGSSGNSGKQLCRKMPCWSCCLRVVTSPRILKNPEISRWQDGCRK
ncbi:hypothetical protein [Mesorhizobium sp. 131-2-5]|uniref:hypothetical protein n=1 Tax=Mesorhizobium sp. 131-2-5 TaxID=2744519 RepID=UPI001928BC96|nr:hypothetical protein [Mesorhizobium sp. 131-2-5]